MLVHVLDKKKLDINVTNEFTAFEQSQGFDNVRLLLTVTEDDFKSAGHDIDLKMCWRKQGLNKMCDEQPLDAMSESSENMWFLGLSKHVLMQCMIPR